MEMVDDIRKEFINILMNVDWMDEKTNWTRHPWV
jgi:hypothetical protein